MEQMRLEMATSDRSGWRLVGRLAATLCLASAFSVVGCDGDPAGPKQLFNGKDLTGWAVLSDGYYNTAGKVHVRDGQLVLEYGRDLTGVQYKGEFPKDDYVVSLEAMRVEGSDFFCGMTFPVAGGYTTLILGGWGGQVVGLSNVDGAAADENEWTQAIDFKNGEWYHVELMVTEGHVDLWIDQEKVIELKTKGREFDVWPQQEDARPFGVTTWGTTGALKNITLRKLPPSAE